LPRSKKQFPLTAQYIEDIHDQGIAIAFPGLEPVHPHDCLDRNLLESAAEQPFQGGFGVDYFYPTIYDKAACLFFSIAGGHIFGNGNKRTGVLALDQFLWANLFRRPQVAGATETQHRHSPMAILA
jgi:prophage maintenance system killer protein